MTNSYIKELVDAYPDISEIWLIGSRAAGTQRDDSDWDYLVFGDERILRSLTRRKRFKVPGVDILIVYDGKHFKKPWVDNGRRKHGSLSCWCWRTVSPTEARYRGTKPATDSDFNVQLIKGSGQRGWPR